jgi:ATPase subunit of ABC transporter with duplicated ATPase domains
MRVQLAGVGKQHGAQLILDQVLLTIGPRARIGLVGPNGVGKSTLLRIVAGVEQPDAGVVVRASERLTIGYLEQERPTVTGETLGEVLARRTGVADAERELAAAADALATGGSDDLYSEALERLVSLGGGDFEARARTACAEVGLAIGLDGELAGLSGGERAKVELAAILLARFDVLLLDEPTNDLDFDGLDRLERFLASYEGALVVVSHDREFLDRTVQRIAEIDPHTRTVREWAGGWTDFEAARAAERAAALAGYERARERRKQLTELVSTRRSEARARGAALGDKTGGQDRRATHALATKVRQAQRLLERNPLPDRPFEPWELRLTLRGGERLSDSVLSLAGAVARRGGFRLGPIDLDLAPGERLAVIGSNGSGKTTLLGMLLGELPLAEGTRAVGPKTVLGAIGQERAGYSGDGSLLEATQGRTGLTSLAARTLLAKFGLGQDHVGRPCSSLSPGERTRAHLAELQACGVNVLVLDEPTNHLDVEATEQLEAALAGYEGTLVVVSHDRRFLERVAPTREVSLLPDPAGRVTLARGHPAAEVP